ncbi:MAG: hypothetical protein LBG71_04475 [Clostridiales Family XIII bacterium]|nr:hypothetical protein [Clostridiales Family XIII bacterium]
MRLFNNKRIFKDKGTYDDKHLYKGGWLFGKKPRNDETIYGAGIPSETEQPDSILKNAFLHELQEEPFPTAEAEPSRSADTASVEPPAYADPSLTSFLVTEADPNSAAVSLEPSAHTETSSTLFPATEADPGDAADTASVEPPARAEASAASFFADDADPSDTADTVAVETPAPAEASAAIGTAHETLAPMPTIGLTPQSAALRVGSKKKRFVGRPSYTDADIIKAFNIADRAYPFAPTPVGSQDGTDGIAGTAATLLGMAAEAAD